MNALLYALVVVIWGTTWIAIFLQQGPVAAPVSIFWRFAVASVTMLAILLVTRRLRPLGAKIISAACCRAAASSALISGVLYRRRLDQYRSGIGDLFDGGTV